MKGSSPFILGLLLMGAACHWPGLAERVVKGPKIKGTVLAPERSTILPTTAFGDEFPAEARDWTPTWEDVQRTDLLVRQHVQAELPAAHLRWDEYHRQYAGYRGALGDVLYVNFSASPNPAGRPRRSHGNPRGTVTSR